MRRTPLDHSARAPGLQPERDGPSVSMGDALVGRATDLDALRMWARRGSGLLTLTGTAGVGKSRLAIEYVSRFATDDGFGTVLNCDVSTARTADEIARAVASGLGLTAARESTVARVVRVLRAQAERRPRVLVVLDDIERLDPSATAMLGEWLTSVPSLALLATSRGPLKLGAESLHDVMTLSVPAAGRVDGDAMTLLFERLRRGGANTQFEENEQEALAALVRGLDGVPLALELAAARLRVLSPGEGLARLTERFALLSRAPRRPGDRHATLVGAIEASWKLLEPWERSALAQCSVFAGGFTILAAEGVIDLSRFESAPPSIDVVQSLRDQSLLRPLSDAAYRAHVRMATYASVRAFVWERTSPEDREAARCRHASWFARAAGRWTARADVDGRSPPELESERENLFEASRWCLDPSRGESRDAIEMALVVLVALRDSVFSHGPLEDYLSWLDVAIERADRMAADRGLRADARLARSRLGRHARGLQSAADDAAASCALARELHDVRREARALVTRGGWLAMHGEPHEAPETFERAAALFRAADVPHELARALFTGASVLRPRGSDSRELAARMLEEALDVVAGGQYPDIEARVAAELGLLSLEQGQRDRGAELLAKAIALNGTRDAWLVSLANVGLGLIAQENADFDRAASLLQTAGDTMGALGDARDEGLYRGYLGALEHERRHWLAAETQLRRACALLRVVEEDLYAPLFEAHLAAVSAQLGDIAAAEARFHAAETAPCEAIPLRTAIGVLHGLLDLAHAGASGDVATAERLREQARARAVAPTTREIAVRSDEVRCALRILESALDASRPERGTTPPPRIDAEPLRVHAHGWWFQLPGGNVVSLGRRRVIAALLVALADQRIRAPGVPVASDALHEAVWRGERMSVDAAGNRLRVSLSTLRSLGLRAILRTVGDGYLLDPAVPCEWIDIDEPAGLASS